MTEKKETLKDRIVKRLLEKEGRRADEGHPSLSIRIAFAVLKVFGRSGYRKDMASAHSEEWKQTVSELDRTSMDPAGNEAFLADGYIGSQAKLPFVPFGPKGNTAANGCGWISVFNALKIIGCREQPSYLIHEMEGGCRRRGTGGVNPFYIFRWLKARGFRVKMLTGFDNMERAADTSDAFILCYLYRAKKGGIGGHFIAGKKQGGIYTIYNGEKPGETHPESIRACVSKNSVLCMMITIEQKKQDC